MLASLMLANLIGLRHRRQNNMKTVSELWERVQEMFRNPSDFERWINKRNPQNAAELEQLYKEWTYKQQFTNVS